MKIGIIGTGNMGSALGSLFAQAGHEVFFGSRDPKKGLAKARETGHGAAGGGIRDAATFAPVLFLATHFTAVPEALEATGPLEGKILVECVNPLTTDFMGLTCGHTTSAGEEIAAIARGARVVTAFNHVFAQVLREGPQFGTEKAITFICGDDEAAKRVVQELVTSTGFVPIDAGLLQNARYLEPLAQLVIQLAYRQGRGPGLALGLLGR
jgi:NADPH-dependent F420 reductase